MSKKSKEKIEHLNLVLNAIRSVNRLMLREKDADRLLKSACHSLIKTRGYHNAWIALIDEDSRFIKTAEAGLGNDFLPILEQLKVGEMPDCGRRAFSQSGVLVVGNPMELCTDCPLAQMYAGRAAMIVKLENQGINFGILTVSIPAELAEDEEEQVLFHEVADDIAFALHDIKLGEEKRQLEDALRDNEGRLSQIVNGNSIPTFVVDHNHIITHWNKACENLTGISANEIIGTNKQWLGFYSTERPVIADLVVDGATEEEIAGEYGSKCRESSVIEGAYEAEGFFPDLGKGGKWLFFTAVPLKNNEGKLIGAVETLQDITERKRAEETLLKSQKNFRDLVENSLIGILIIQNGQIIYKNPEVEKLSGPVDQAGKFFNVVSIHPDDDEKVKHFFQRITSGEAQSLDTDFRFYPVGKKNSRPDMKWVYCRASLVEYQGKEAILVNMTDITRSKETEHLLKIQDKMSSLGRVAAGIAHEIRNPLSGINIYLNTLEKIYGKTSDKEESLEKVKKILKQLQSASRKIESVIKRVMDFSKPSEPKFILTDINQPIEEAINLSSVTLRKSGVTIEKSLTANLPKCYIDPHLIEEVVLNLITNAAEAMKNMDREKKIKITSFVKNSHIFLRISDSGPGVLSHLRDKIFDPFYTTKNDSSGIGLSLSHRIITDHGGSVEVGLSELGGAGFMIKIPIKKEEDEE